MLKPCGEAGANLPCQALVRAELYPLTVQRRKSLFMLMLQGFQASVSDRRSFASLRELILHTELPSWHTVPPSIFTSIRKIREISLSSSVETETSTRKPCTDHFWAGEKVTVVVQRVTISSWQMLFCLEFYLLSFTLLAGTSCLFTLIEGSLISS